jgi:exonuclease 3'-5' domain-containing protein 1
MDLKPILVESVEHAKATVAVLARESRLGLDCEGVNLGPDGEVTLVQIVTPDSDIYLFDVLTCPEIAPILKPILESESILKVRKEVGVW